jgi:alpha-L-fucosidase
VQLDQWQNNKWEPLATATSIGSQRLIRIRPVTTSKVRLRVTKCPVSPAISRVGFFSEPVMLDAPLIARNAEGALTITTPAPVEAIRYTLDGSDPTVSSTMYEQPVELPLGGSVKARAFDGSSAGTTATADLDVIHTGWKIVSPEGDKTAKNAIDGKPKTLWSTKAGCPQSIEIDLGKPIILAGFTYLPRQDGSTAGMVDQYTFEVSTDGKQWEKAAGGEFGNIAANPLLQRVRFDAKHSARFVKFTATHVVDGAGITVAELGVTAE